MVIVIVLALRRRLEGLRAEVSAMAGAAGDGRAGVVDLRYILRVDHLHHAHHLARRGLLGFRVVGEVEPRLSIGGQVFGVGSVARAALGAQFGLPFFHDVVYLLAGQVLGQHLQVGGRRMRSVRRRCVWRRLLR